MRAPVVIRIPTGGGATLAADLFRPDTPPPCSHLATTNTVHYGGSADMQGEARTTATLGTGEAVVVHVQVRLTPDSLRLHGRVTIDDAVISNRHWDG